MKPFADTDIVIYAQQQGEKGDMARRLLAAGCIVSVQVLNEFASVAHRKLGRSRAEIGAAITDIVSVTGEPVALTLALNSSARAVAAEGGVSFYDALIVAAALQAGCDTLLTEDMRAGRKFGRLTVVNPFAEEQVGSRDL